MKKSPYIFSLIFSIIILLAASCNKDESSEETPQNITIPILSTFALSEITSSSATSGGNISSNGGSPIISRGVCWNTLVNPTIQNNLTSDGSGIGEFLSHVENLIPNTQYFLRAYATNDKGTAYGNEISFTTVNPNTQVTPEFEILKIVNGKEIRSLIKTNDGGYIAIAFAQDYDVIKFDENFNITWNKTYGGSSSDYAGSIIQTLDGGYMVIGNSESNDGNVTGNHGDSDIWVCKLDGSGNLSWQKSYGGSNIEGVGKETSLLQTIDGGYMFMGYTQSEDGDVSINKGEFDAWLVKINSSGDILFEKTFGGSENDYGRQIISTDSNFTVSLGATSADGDFNAPGNWIIQVDQNGNVNWETNLDVFNTGFINTTSDNNLIVVNNSATQYLLNKLDQNGNIIMSKTIDFQTISSKQPSSVKVQETSDHGFIVIGDLGNGGYADALLFRVTTGLDLLYHKIYSGNGLDMPSSFFPINTNNYIYQFFTFSHDIEGIEYSSDQASVIIKLKETIN